MRRLAAAKNGSGEKDGERKAYLARRRVYRTFTTGLAIVVGEKVLVDRIRFAHEGHSCWHKGHAND